MPTQAQPLDSEKVPRVLYLGFACIIFLLSVAGFAAFRSAHALREGLADLATDEFLISRLVHDVQVEQNVLTEVLHRLAYLPKKREDSVAIFEELEESVGEIERLAQQAHQVAGNRLWKDLQEALQRFSAEVRRILDTQKPVPPENQERLFLEHRQVVGLINELIRDCSERLTRAESEVEQQSRSLEFRAAAIIGAGLLLSVGCALATIWFVRRSIRRIQWHSDELARVSWQMIQTQEDAARRFSHELHDELGQALAALRANLATESTTDLETLRADCVGLVDECIGNVRELSQLLRPVLLDDFGLDASLRWLTEKFSQRTRIRVEYLSTCEERFADDTETHLFRIAQEALTNVAKHAKASEVHVSLGTFNGQVRLSISDNGRGIEPQIADPSGRPTLGLVGMRARARHCGGTLLVHAQPSGGVCVEARVPHRARLESV